MTTLESARLTIIPFSKHLIQLALSNRQQLATHLNATIPPNWPNPDFAEFLPILLASLENEPEHETWDMITILKEPRIVIGGVGFKGGPDEQGCAEIGYDILPEYQRHGYATEMAQTAITWAFNVKGVKKVFAECLLENTPSIRVLEKLGMHRTGIDGDMITWELTRAVGRA